MAHKPAAYEYWVVECHEDSTLIPVRRAFSVKGRYRSPRAPVRFQAKCPICEKTDGYERTELRVEKTKAFPLIPVDHLPKFSK